MADNVKALDDIFKSIDIIIDGRLQGLKFDKTITCSILSNKNAARGEYTVTDGATTFKAYSDVTTYQVNQYVYVKVPNGSFNNKKIITGRYVEENSEYYTYVPPLDSFIDMSHNLIDNSISEMGLVANGQQKEIVVWEKHNLHYNDYDRIGIRAGFKTWLNQYDLVKGNYGLKLYVAIRRGKDNEPVESQDIFSVYFTLDTSDFYGSLYNYETFYNQEKVFDIGKYIDDKHYISDIRLVFFQDSDFENAKGNKIASTMPGSTTELPKNIFMASPYIGIGYNKNKYPSDTALLYTFDSLDYKALLSDEDKANFIAALDTESETYLQDRDNILYDAATAKKLLSQLNRRKLQARWIHFDEDMNPSVLEQNSDLPETAQVHWYRYFLEEGLSDKLAGAFWKEIETPNKNYFEYKDFEPDMNRQHDMLKVIIEYPSRETIAKQIYDLSLETGEKENPETGKTDKVGDLLYSFLPADKKPDDKTYYEYIEEAKLNLTNAIQKLDDLLEDYELQANRVDELYKELDERQQEYKAAHPDKTDDDLATDKEYLAIATYFNDQVDNLKDRTNEKRDELQAISNEVSAYEAEINYYSSSVVEFKNSTNVIDNTSVDLISGLDIVCDPEGYNGVYRIYDDNGDIMSSSESVKKRTLTATYESLVTGDKTLDTAEKIYWYIPINNTMIQYPTEGTEYSYYTQVDVTDSEYNAAMYKDKYFIKDLSGIYHPATSKYSNTEKYYERNTTSTSKTKDGNYFVICRSGVSIDSEAGTAESKNDSQVFRIKSYYSQSAVNNTIRCIIEKNGRKFEKDITLVFGPTGINGTTYTLSLEFDNKVPAVTVAADDGKNGSGIYNSVKVIPHLYDYQNNDVTAKFASAGNISYSWYCQGNEGLGISDPDETDGSVELFGKSANIEDYKYYILQCSVKDATEIVPNNKITLTAYLPIPVRASEIYTAFDGVTKITYDSGGGNPQFYKDGYKIYKFNNDTGNNEPVTNATWEMSLGKDTTGIELDKEYNITSVITQYYPTVTSEGVLSAPAMFLEDNGKQVGVSCKINDEVVWFQPLYIYQNSYSSSLLNSWDGSLTQDEKNGTILSTMIGAGKKDSFNRFNGVLMGDISAANNQRDIGLYGYHEGVQSYGLNINGTAFIGKSGRGQIKFNGNSGYIQSGNYGKSGAGGMQIDLNNGILKIIGEKFTQAQIKANGRIFQGVDQAYAAQRDYYDSIKKNLNNQVTYCSNRIDKLKTLQKEYQNNADGYENAINGDNGENKVKQTAQSNLDILNGTGTNSIKYVQSQITKVQEQIKNKKKELTNAQKSSLKASEKMKKISSIKSEISNLNSQLSGYQTSLKQKKAERDDLKATITACDSKIKTYIQRKNFYTKRIKELTDEIATLSANKTKYEKQITNYETLIKSLNDTISKYSAATDDEKVKYENSMVNYLRENLPDSFEITTQTTGSQIIISSLSPYLKIVSNSNKTLLNIADSSYYLQTNDFIQHVFDSKTNKFTTPGEGMKIDLQKGKITSYNFDLIAYDSKGDNAGSFVQISQSGNPYLRVYFKDSTRNLDIFRLTKTEFFLNSHDWVAGKSGMKLDLSKGSITAFNNFNLKATINTKDEDNERYNGSYVQIKSGNPFFTVHFKDSDSKSQTQRDGLDLIKIGTTQWLMQSQNWVDGSQDITKGSGIQFNMATGKITAYSFTIKAYKSADKYIYINSAANDNPLEIGKKFKVNWEGEVTASYITASGGKIGPFTIDNTSLYIKSDYGIGIDTAEVYLGEDGLSVNSGGFVAYKKSKTGNFPTFSLKTSNGRNVGIITDTSKTFTYSTYIKGGILVKEGGMKIEGSLYTSGTTTIGSTLYVTANTYVGGTLTTMGTLTINDTAYINGGTTINGNLTVNGNITGKNWGVTNNNGATQSTQTFGNIAATGGNIGGENGWIIQSGYLKDKNNKIILNANETKISVGTITIFQSSTNAGQINFGNKAYMFGSTEKESVLFIEAKAIIQGNLKIPRDIKFYIQSSVNTNDVNTYNGGYENNEKLIIGIKGLKVTDKDGTEANTHYFKLGATNDGAPGTCTLTLGKLAFANNIKKKFNISSVNFDFWYKVDTPDAPSLSTQNYAPWSGSYITARSYTSTRTRYICYNKEGGYIGEYDSPISGAINAAYPVYDVIYVVQGDVSTPSVDFSTVEQYGYTKKRLALSKEGTKEVEFGPSDSSSDTITLTNVDFS